MAKIRQRRITWNPSTSDDVVGYDVYATDASVDSDAWINEIDAGAHEPVQRVPNPEYYPDQPEGNYQYAVVVIDDAGNESDPHQAEVWRNVPLDVTAPDAVTGGAIEFVDG